MTRILINAFSAKVGGGKTYIHNLLSRLPNPDVRFDKIYLYAPDDLKIPEQNQIVRLKTNFPTDSPIFRKLWEMFFLPVMIRKLDIDCLFVPGGVHSTPRFLLPKKTKIITMFRNMLPFDPQNFAAETSFFEKGRGYLRRSAMLDTMKGADHVIFISKFARSVIENLISVRGATTIPHGISENFFSSNLSIQARPNLSFVGPYFLYVSRFEFYKRHLEVVQAFELLPPDIQKKYKLLFVGGTDLPYGKRVVEYAQQSACQQQIVFLGDYPYQDLPALYQNARINLFASSCENCPNILLEAMGAGRPILNSTYEPMPEFGGDAVDYASPDDPKQIAAGILKILNRSVSEDSQIADRLRERSQEFGWSITAEKTWKLLSEVGGCV